MKQWKLINILCLKRNADLNLSWIYTAAPAKRAFLYREIRLILFIVSSAILSFRSCSHKIVQILIKKAVCTMQTVIKREPAEGTTVKGCLQTKSGELHSCFRRFVSTNTSERGTNTFSIETSLLGYKNEDGSVTPYSEEDCKICRIEL